MRAESTHKPAQRFQIEEHNGIATIRFYENIQKAVKPDEEGGTTETWVYDEYVLQVPAREGLATLVEAHHAEWLAMAIAQENAPKPKTEREIILHLQGELDQLQAENAFLLLELAKGGV